MPIIVRMIMITIYFSLKVDRTALRPLASGELTHEQALVFLSGLLTCGLGVLLSLNWYRLVSSSHIFFVNKILPNARFDT